MRRADALAALGRLVTGEDLLISAAAGTADDWWNYRPSGSANTFTVSALGQICPLALGLAIALPHRRIIALDADGSVLMNVGALCTLGNENVPNLTVLVLDNGVYESTGSHVTHTGRHSDLARMAEGAGCLNCVTVDTVPDLAREASRMLVDGQFGFLVARIAAGKHQWPADKRKPTEGVEDKFHFMRYVELLEGIPHRRRPRG